MVNTILDIGPQNRANFSYALGQADREFEHALNVVGS